MSCLVINFMAAMSVEYVMNEDSNFFLKKKQHVWKELIRVKTKKMNLLTVCIRIWYNFPAKLHVYFFPL